MTDSTRAFVLRIAPSEIDRVPEALRSNDAIIGWADAVGLLNPKLTWEQFRAVIHNAYHKNERDYARSGRGAGIVWTFIREIQRGSLLVVPHGPQFYVAEVVGDARYEPSKRKDDTSYRRSVRWLNEAKPIPRQHARAALQARMKVRQTCATATDLIDHIREALDTAKQGSLPSFDADLRKRLIGETLREIQSGRMNDRGFENLVAVVMRSLGARTVEVIPRQKDKGADILATFLIAGSFGFTLAAQAKHYQASPPVTPGVLDQLVSGMEAESADLGWVVTSGTFSDEAVRRKVEIAETKGHRIELIDGVHLAAMIVEGGLKTQEMSAMGETAISRAQPAPSSGDDDKPRSKRRIRATGKV